MSSTERTSREGNAMRRSILYLVCVAVAFSLAAPAIAGAAPGGERHG